MDSYRIIERGLEKTPITVSLSGEQWQALVFCAAAGMAGLKTFAKDDDDIMNALNKYRPLYEQTREVIQTKITAAHLRARAAAEGGTAA